MAKIPEGMKEPINTAFPDEVLLIGTVMNNGFANITLRGSAMVFDDTRMAHWERGRGQTNETLEDGAKVTYYFRSPKLMENGVAPAAGVVRIYGTAHLHKEGDIREQVWDRMIQPEKDRDPEKKGYAVLVDVEKVINLLGQPVEGSE